jgi:hypothetical protein
MKSIRRVARRFVHALGRSIAGQVAGIAAAPSTAAQQVLLAEWYRAQAREGNGVRDFRDIGFQVYSQGDEDGILLYLFALLGSRTRIALEICAGDGKECNSANLILNHKWHGVLLDGSERNVWSGKDWYYRHRAALVSLPRFEHAWITRDNVNEVVRRMRISGEIDLLSLDIDGNDYWVWEALDVVSPRVVLAEYNPILGPERSTTIPYAPNFDAYQYPMYGWLPNYCGASLAALTKLARQKGYRLVGTSSAEFNAFFVREDVASGVLPEVTVASCFRSAFLRQEFDERWKCVQHLPWVEV